MIELRAGIDSGLEGVEIRQPAALASGHLFSWMFEGLGGASFLYPWDALHPAWGPRPGGAFGYELEPPGNSEHPVRLEVCLQANSECQLDLEAALVNRSERTFAYCWADMCLMFKHAPGYPDQAGERCLLDTDRGPLPADRWPRASRSDAWSPAVQSYRVAGIRVPFPYGVVQGLALWSTSPEPVRSGCIMMARQDGQWHVGLAWDRAASVAHNPDDDHHCIHSAPWFGTLPPLARILRRGVILFVEGSAGELLRRYEAWRGQL
jgi:hypothetical protein